MEPHCPVFVQHVSWGRCCLRVETQAFFEKLLQEAWKVRTQAYVIGPTKVGCSLLSGKGVIYTGCNVEHKFRSHDVHAEVNAITNMIASGEREIAVVAIAAERDSFTPCGACMDWIFQFANPGSCIVICQSHPDGPIAEYLLRDMMPFYPR